MISNRRENDRVVRRLPVRFWRVGEERTVNGYTTNISTTGMFVVTHQPFPKGARLRVEVLDPRSGFMVEAEVAHAHKVSLELSALGTSGMGLRFLPIETLVRELFPQAFPTDRSGRPTENPAEPPVDPWSAHTGSRPAVKPVPAPAPQPARPGTPPAPPAPARSPSMSSKRVPIVRLGAPSAPAPPGKASAGVTVPIAVRFSSLEQFRSVYERDLAHGGLFVATFLPAKIGDLVEIELHLPAPLEGMVPLRARVVHRIDAQGGEGLGGPNLLAGIGVELADRSAALAEIGKRLAAIPPG